MKAAPKLIARFKLDATGKPQFRTANGHKHYKLKLYVQDAPENAETVTYKLHSSYYDPVREVDDRLNNFKEKITSYGDYHVRAELRGPKLQQSLTKLLSQMLKEGHPDLSSNAALRTALDDIAAN